MAKTRKSSESLTGAASKSAPVPEEKNTGIEVLENNINGDCGNGKLRCKSLVVDGTKYRTRLNYKFENRIPYEPLDGRKIISEIPGTVLKIQVEEGQKVKKGEQMLILEAMKMKNRILFPKNGTVKKILVKEGEKISKDHLMVELK
ncbi:acetyl-CoA carboxylase biotin carboxyl carrier protein subunit [Bacteroidota bacterium]